MLGKIINKYGFTLIELLIVVAIIGIVAAIAIPQFAVYRIRSYNTSAISDLKNAKTTQEALFAAYQTYGATETGVTLLLISGAGGPGALIAGVTLPVASDSVSGSAIAGLSPGSVKAGLGIGASNGVCFYSTSIPGAGSNAYIMVAKHTQGNKVFVSESASPTIKFVQNDDVGTFIGVSLAVGGSPAAGIPVAASTASTITSATNGNGSPYPNWSPL